MRREDISGFTLTLFGYSLEFVTVLNFLKVIALWKNANLKWRWDICGESNTSGL
jgi:hypothetical protein